MDISELKQQLMPVFEQKTSVLKKLLRCLESRKTVDTCLTEESLFADSNNESDKQKNQQIITKIKSKISENSITQEKVISELKKILFEIEKVTQCLHAGKTANDLKDCVLVFDKK